LDCSALAVRRQKKPDGTRAAGNDKTIAKKQAMSARALPDLDRWIADSPQYSGGVSFMSLPRDEPRFCRAMDRIGVLFEARRVFHRRARRFRSRGRRSPIGAASARFRCRGGPTIPRAICSQRDAGAAGLARPACGRNFVAGRSAGRGFINGVALHLAKPSATSPYIRSAKQRRCAELIVPATCHNDLAQGADWLRGSGWKRLCTDFQLRPASDAGRVRIGGVRKSSAIPEHKRI